MTKCRRIQSRADITDTESEDLAGSGIDAEANQADSDENSSIEGSPSTARILSPLWVDSGTDNTSPPPESSTTRTVKIKPRKAAEGKKDLKKRNGTNTYIKLDDNEPFDTFKAQVLVRIEKYLKPSKLDFSNYDISFSIPRISPSPIAVAQEEDYKVLLERIAKHKDRSANVYVQEKLKAQSKRSKENMRAGDEGESCETSEDDEKPKKRRGRSQRASDIDGANTPHNDNIKALRMHWACHKKPGCSSEFCFVNPTDSTHFQLGHSHFDVWAAAMLKGEQFATLNTPPHHHLFNALSNNQLGQLSPLLERRLRGTSASAPSAPVINFNVPAELFGAFRPPPVDPAPGRPGPSPLTPATSPMLLPSSRNPGPRIPLAEFCTLYDLSENIRSRLDEQGYIGSHTFRFAELQELKDAVGLKSGEIAQLKDAVFQWSEPH
ncbi:hypothetical protein BD779DRAFT_1613105 [Infundibulicybe gibba]|nr:hypothetical protein BD779DRAFT_1613105 [Infundibulicybe gibba]